MSDGSFQTLPFRYDRSDFVALAVLGRPRILAWLFGIAAVLFMLAGALILVSLLSGSTRVLEFVPPLLVLLAVYVLLYRYGPHVSAYVLERRARRDDLLREQRMTVTDEGFIAQSSRGRTEIRWAAVPRIHAAETSLFIYSTRRQAFIIPERAFGSRADFLAFAAAARSSWQHHHRM